ncbi:CLAVATA3/ESR (CLE)-related protein 5-like, partial [Quillaja saponaria]
FELHFLVVDCRIKIVILRNQMATLSKSSFLILSLVIFTMLLLSSTKSEARLINDIPNIHKKLNSQLILHELRDRPRKVYNPSRSMQSTKQVDRVSPDGPDPHHH